MDLEAIKARLAAATPGPWQAVRSEWKNKTTGHTWSAYGIEQDEQVYGDYAQAISYATTTGQIGEKDAAFIAHAPADIAALVAEVERLRALLDAARAWHTAITTPDGVAEAERELVEAIKRVDG